MWSASVDFINERKCLVQSLIVMKTCQCNGGYVLFCIIIYKDGMVNKDNHLCCLTGIYTH